MENKKQNPIIIILVAIFIVGIIIFAVAGGKNKDKPKGSSSEASTISSETVSDVVSDAVPDTDSDAVPSTDSGAGSHGGSVTVSNTEPENLGIKVPDEIKSYFSKSVSDVFGTVPEPDGYYGGGAYFYTPDNNYILIYPLDDYNNVVTISGEIGKLIEGKTSCSYTELKEIFGENISEFMQNDIDGGYWCEAAVDGFSLKFDSLTSEFETFYIYRQ